MRTTIALCISVAVSSLTGAAQEALTPKDMASWAIVCDPAATESERYAAEEFQSLFREMTGSHLSIVESAPEDGGVVYVGPDATAASGLALPDADFGEEGFHIEISDSAIQIFGGRPRGTLYGVYEFFEHHCGVRYLTHDHTYFPEEDSSGPIPLGSHRFSPVFDFRWSQYLETSSNPAFAARLRTNTVSDDPRLGGRTGFRLVSHNVAQLVPPSEYGESHPEYYALVDGRRKIEMHGGGPQLCMTNPEVLEVVVRAVLDEIEQNPTVRNIDVGQMDNTGYCTCDNCAAIDAREESHAGATFSFVNAVAERIEKSHPDVLISTYAYQYTRKPPKTLRARHNVMIQLCSMECCMYHAIGDPNCAVNSAFTEDAQGWTEKAENIFIWHYNANFRGYLLPFPNLKSIGPSVDYFTDLNGRGVYMQAASNSLSAELSDMRNYVMSRCLWKPGRDSWEEAQTFCRLHYAEAAGPILEYLEYYHDLVGEANLHPGNSPTESSLRINPESARRIAAYFDEALSLAESETIRDRVEKASISAYRALLSAAGMRLSYANGVCTPDIEGVRSNLVEEYAALCAKYDVTMDTEHTSADTYITNMRTLFAGIKAAMIENDFWRVVVLPERNAKIIEMTYKPANRNILQPSRSLDRFRFEEWMRQGEGPSAFEILPCEAQADGTHMSLHLETPDGSRLERTISLDGDAVRFETALIAGAPRRFDMFIHPEYDAGTHSDDPEVLSLYVRNPEWTHANAGWRKAAPTAAQLAVIRSEVAGGAFAYYNHAENFGVEQRFAPDQIESMAHFWSPARRQVNLELFTPVIPLEEGEQAGYAYEVRYLNAPPR